MANEKFNDYKSFTKHLVDQGCIAEGKESTVLSYCAAFEGFQRQIGVQSAKNAMIKAIEKVR